MSLNEQLLNQTHDYLKEKPHEEKSLDEEQQL